jgi:hypothetical protein
MNAISITRRHARTTRRRRSAELNVAVTEDRLAPSPTLPLPPPHVAGVVAQFPSGPCSQHDPGVGASVVQGYHPPVPV